MSVIYGALRRLARTETAKREEPVLAGEAASREEKSAAAPSTARGPKHKDQPALPWWREALAKMREEGWARGLVSLGREWGAKGVTRLREDRRFAAMAAAGVVLLLALLLLLIGGGKREAVKQPTGVPQAQLIDEQHRHVPYDLAIPPIATRPVALAVQTMPMLPGASPSRRYGKEVPTLEKLVAAAGGTLTSGGDSLGQPGKVESAVADLAPEPEPAPKFEPKTRQTLQRVTTAMLSPAPEKPREAPATAGASGATPPLATSSTNMAEATRVNRIAQQFQRALQAGDNDQALERLQELILLKGNDNPFVLKMRAYWELQQGSSDQAGTLLRQVAEKWPEDLDTGINLILLDMRSGNLKPAKERTMRLFASHPDDARLRELLGYMR